MAAAIAHCFQASSVLPERAVLAEALRRGVGRAKPGDVEAAARDGLVVRTINGRRLATTEAVIRDGRDIVACVHAGGGVIRHQHGLSESFPHQHRRQAAAQRHLARDRIAGGEQMEETRRSVATLEAADGA